MLKRLLRYCLYIVASLIVVIGAFAIVVNLDFNKRLTKIYDIEVRKFEIERDSALLSQGKHIALTRGCNDCHGENYEGKIFIDDPGLGRIVAANLTRGKGGIPQDYSFDDFVKAIRHGLDRENRSLKVMPSYEYAFLSDKDMGALVYYLESLPPVDNEVPDHEIKLIGKVLTFLGKLPTFPAEKVDHNYLQPKEIMASVSADYGKYLSTSCVGCHRDDLRGGEPIIPGQPYVLDITSSGAAGRWTIEQFISTLRTGNTPEGKELPNEFMPWQLANNYSDDELKALYLYLKSL
jgi:mono/diheme cytochrome c family protein